MIDAQAVKAKITHAVAQGWCHRVNSGKEFDIDLASAIVQEILAVGWRNLPLPEPALVPLSEAEVVKVWQGMPGGPEGWLKNFGFIQFAESIANALATSNGLTIGTARTGGVMKQRLATQLELIYIDNYPDRRASGMSATALIYWGVRMGLISEQEKDQAMGFASDAFNKG